MSKSQTAQLRDEVAKFVGLFVIVGLALAVIAGLAYAVLGSLTDTGRHILSTALLFSLPLAFWLGLNTGKAHVRGVERGLDLKIGAKERAAQPARPAPVAPVVSPSAQTYRADDYLPKLQSAVIIQPRDEDNGPIVL